MEHLERTKHQHAAMTAEPSDTGTSVRTRLDNRTVFLFFFFSSFLFLFHIIVGDSWVPSISEPAQVPESPYFTFETFYLLKTFYLLHHRDVIKRKFKQSGLKKKPKIPVGDNWCHGDDYQLSLLTRAFCFGLCTCSPTNGKWMPPITLQNDH